MADPLSPSVGITLSDNQRLAFLRLIRSENVGPATFIDLIRRFGTANAALDALPELASRGRGKKITIASLAQAEQEQERLEKLGGQFVCLGEPNYPPALRAADAPPPVLAVLGSPTALTRRAIGIVGSRNASIAGIKIAKQLAREISEAGYLTVSGLARGIDSATHAASIEQGTVAVFAGGIDHVYPPENQELAQSILDHDGALISEMPFGWQPRARDFPRRNRIVAGASLAVVVIEAARRSGSLITARLANEMGRLVFAVPGSPLDPRSEGANGLIKQGASLLTSSKDILETIDMMTDISRQQSYSLEDDPPTSLEEPKEKDRDRIMSAMGHTPTDIDELIRFTELAPAMVQLLLLELDLAGRLERLSGNRVMLN